MQHETAFGAALKHTTTLFSLSDHDILSREWRVIVDQVQTNYDSRFKGTISIRCDRAAHYEGSSLLSGVFFKSVKTLGVLHF